MESKKSDILLYILMGVLALIWGLSFIFTKLALEKLSTLEVLALRWPIAAIIFILLVIFKVVKVDFKGKPKKELIALVLFQPCLYSLFETIGVDITTASESSIITATIPLMVVINSAIIFKQKNNYKTVMGIVVAFIGVMLCVVFSPGFSIGGKGVGYLALIGAIIVGSLYSILTNRQGKYYTAVEIAFAMTVSGGVWFFMISLLAGNGLNPYRVFLSCGSVTLSVIYLAALCSIVAFFIFNMSLVRLNPAIAACINTNTINVVGVVAGIIILGDPWGWYTILGLILMIVGIVVATMKKD